MVAEPVRVQGLRDFSRNLKKIDKDLPKALRIALNEAANVVVDDAKPHIPRRTGRAASTLKAKSTRALVRVSGGGRRAPYYPFLDFGGVVGRGNSVVRPFKKEGRYIYKSYFRQLETGEFESALENALLNVVRKAGIEVD